MSDRADTSRPRTAALLPAALLLVVALWEILGVARAERAVATEADWQAAAGWVRARHRAGELIVTAPDWLDPLGRRWLGDLIPVEMAARMDAARYPVIWEISARGAQAPEVAGLAPVDAARFGALEARRYQRVAAEVVTDFVLAAGQADGRPSASLEEVGFAPHRCIKVVPRPDGSVLVRFADVELGRTLVGYVGLADVFTRRDIRAPGRLHVAVDGDEVARVEVGVDDGWVRFEAPTRPGRASVVFQATAVGKDAKDRRICFAAEARR